MFFTDIKIGTTNVVFSGIIQKEINSTGLWKIHKVVGS